MKKLSVAIVILIGVIFIMVAVNSYSSGKTEEEVLNNTEFSNISIQSENTYVEFLPANLNDARVELTNNRNYKLDTQVKGDTLEVKVKDRWFQFISIDFFNFSPPTLTLYLPNKLYEQVQVNTDNGTIRIDDFTAEQLAAQTDNGKILLSNVKSSDISTETDNGSTHLENVEGNINSETDNGRITLITDSLDRHIDLETDNGSIVIRTENEPTNATLNISTDNGKITVFGESFYDTVVGDGEYEVRLKTDNGKVTIEKQ